jgi:hypothetical protein
MQRLLSAESTLRGAWIWAGAGASELSSGAFEAPTLDGSLPAASRSQLAAFAKVVGWSLTPKNARVATLGGLLREVSARDTAVLDLAPLNAAKVGVVNLGSRWECSAEWLVASYNESAWAKSQSLEFVVLQGEQWLSAEERGLPALLLALRLQQPDHPVTASLNAACAEAGCSAALLPPCVGDSPGAWQAFAERVRLPVGQTLSEVGGLAGLRFERARDELSATAKGLGWDVYSVRLERLTPQAGGFEARFSDGRTLACRAVVLCTGGIAGGGIVMNEEGGQLAPSFEYASAGVGQPLLAWQSVQRFQVASESGFDVSVGGVRGLEAVGFGEGIAAQPGVFIAGDCIADQPRLGLVAALSGVRAAERVLAFLGGGVTR